LIIFPDRIFILIPKCGCVSVMAGFGVNPWGKNIKNKENVEDAVVFMRGGSPHMPTSEIPERFKHLPTEAIVRNPWDRTVSRYYHLIKQTGSDISFEDFVINTPFPFPGRFNVSHWAPDSWVQQSEYISHDTKVHKFEEFDFLVHLNKTEHKPYRELYNHKLQDLIATYYKDDIERFNYEFWPE